MATSSFSVGYSTGSAGNPGRGSRMMEGKRLGDHALCFRRGSRSRRSNWSGGITQIWNCKYCISIQSEHVDGQVISPTFICHLLLEDLSIKSRIRVRLFANLNDGNLYSYKGTDYFSWKHTTCDSALKGRLITVYRHNSGPWVKWRLLE